MVGLDDSTREEENTTDVVQRFELPATLENFRAWLFAYFLDAIATSGVPEIRVFHAEQGLRIRIDFVTGKDGERVTAGSHHVMAQGELAKVVIGWHGGAYATTGKAKVVWSLDDQHEGFWQIPFFLWQIGRESDGLECAAIFTLAAIARERIQVRLVYNKDLTAIFDALSGAIRETWGLADERTQRAGDAKRGAPRVTEHHDAEEKRKLAQKYLGYRRDGVTAQAAADLAGRPLSTIKGWVKKFNLTDE